MCASRVQILAPQHSSYATGASGKNTDYSDSKNVLSHCSQEDDKQETAQDVIAVGTHGKRLARQSFS